MHPADTPPPSTLHALKRVDRIDRQRAILAVLAARRAVVVREAARIELRMRRAGRPDAGAASVTELRAQLAALEARHAELDRTVAHLAAALGRPGDPAAARGVSTDGGGLAAA